MLRWGILGVGRAGAARARAIAADPRSNGLIGYRGDPGGVGLAVAESVEQVLEADVDAVAISTPDTTHPALVRQALLADKHVVVEFPLAGSAREAADLFDLADARGRVLHVEHIELLGPQAAWIRAHAHGRRLTGGVCRFTTGLRADTFGVAHANVARLHRLVDAVGVPDDVAVYERTEQSLDGRLSWPGNPDHYTGDAHVALSFQQADGLRRRTEIVLELDDGAVTQLDRTVLHRGAPVALPPGPEGGLFAADHREAVAEILEGQRPTVGRAQVLAVLELADRLARAPLSQPLPPDQLDLSEFDLDAITWE